MQPNDITLPVDTENDGVGLENQVFTRFEEHLNRSLYIGPNHSMAGRNLLGLYRTHAKVNGNFRGVGKTSFKFTEDIIVAGVDGVSQLTSPIIVEVSFSIPVGATHAQILEARQRALALLDLDTVMTPLNEQLMV